jgi:hypothetical protein
MHSPDHSTKGTPSALGSSKEQWPLTAGEYMVSGSLSSPSRGAFHLSLTVLVRYRSLEVFSLGEWSPQLPTRLHVSRGTQDPDPESPLIATGLSPAPVALSNAFAFCRFSLLSVLQPQKLLRLPGLGSSRFARHYYGNLG